MIISASLQPLVSVSSVLTTPARQVIAGSSPPLEGAVLPVSGPQVDTPVPHLAIGPGMPHRVRLVTSCRSWDSRE
jgi:hypothetical protein